MSSAVPILDNLHARLRKLKSKISIYGLKDLVWSALMLPRQNHYGTQRGI